MKTLLLCMALLALQINAVGQTASNVTKKENTTKNTTATKASSMQSVVDVKADEKKMLEAKAKQEKDARNEVERFKVPSGLDAPTFHFFVLNPPTTKESGFVFLVGSTKLSGYKVQVCNVKFNEDAEITKRFSNGKSAPILQLFVAHKENYIGGSLENENGKKTIITDATIAEDGNTIKFTVVGKDFSRSLTLDNGEILSQNSTTLVLYTDKIGIWKIIKK